MLKYAGLVKSAGLFVSGCLFAGSIYGASNLPDNGIAGAIAALVLFVVSYRIPIPPPAPIACTACIRMQEQVTAAQQRTTEALAIAQCNLDLFNSLHESTESIEKTIAVACAQRDEAINSLRNANKTNLLLLAEMGHRN